MSEGESRPEPGETGLPTTAQSPRADRRRSSGGEFRGRFQRRHHPRFDGRKPGNLERLAIVDRDRPPMEPSRMASVFRGTRPSPTAAVRPWRRGAARTRRAHCGPRPAGRSLRCSCRRPRRRRQQRRRLGRPAGRRGQRKRQWRRRGRHRDAAERGRSVRRRPELRQRGANPDRGIQRPGTDD